MNKEQKYITVIQMDVFDSSYKPKVKLDDNWLGQLKIYYDCVVLSEEQMKALIKMIKILTRWNYSIEFENWILKGLTKLNTKPKRKSDKLSFK